MKFESSVILVSALFASAAQAAPNFMGAQSSTVRPTSTTAVYVPPKPTASTGSSTSNITPAVVAVVTPSPQAIATPIATPIFTPPPPPIVRPTPSPVYQVIKGSQVNQTVANSTTTNTRAITETKQKQETGFLTNSTTVSGQEVVSNRIVDGYDTEEEDYDDECIPLPGKEGLYRVVTDGNKKSYASPTPKPQTYLASNQAGNSYGTMSTSDASSEFSQQSRFLMTMGAVAVSSVVGLLQFL